MSGRHCEWMWGPGEGRDPRAAALWWLTMSRNRLARQVGGRPGGRASATCHRTPAFVSPLAHRPR